MSQQDRERWDKKWAAAGDESYLPHPLLTENAGYLAGGVALDLACGRGQNAIWLAQRGFMAMGIDISAVALRVARAEAERQGLSGRARFMRADLDDLLLARTLFDVVCVFRFLDRSLFDQIRAAVRPGGLVYYCTRHLGALARHPQVTEAYLLRPGELAAVFSDWQILHDHEGPEDSELIARTGLTGLTRWSWVRRIGRGLPEHTQVTDLTD
jgi:SAM-dependent methyltransferase